MSARVSAAVDAGMNAEMNPAPTIHALPAFTDNYIWVVAEDTGNAAIVDPGDAAPVLEYLAAARLHPAAILITHKHHDHVGGIAALSRRYPGLPVYGPATGRIDGVTHPLKGGETARIPGMAFAPRVLDIPGHTREHIGYYAAPALFCGDTLFACGCGRVFCGTMEQLHASLNIIKALPPHTRLYCAHEYTVDNIGFAKWVEPDNPALLRREKAARRAREQGLATVPSLLTEELATNPFLRADVAAVITAAERHAERRLTDAASVFTVLRQWKDREYD